jgi:putative DNA primase/helicase
LRDNIRAGRELHNSICALAAKLISTGMGRMAAEELIRDDVQHAPEPHDERWRERYDDIPRAVHTAWRKFHKQDGNSELPELDLDRDPTVVAIELAALIAARRGILLNGYAPIRVIAEAGQPPRALEINSEMICAYAHEICRCVVNEVEVPLPPRIARRYLEGLQGQWGLRPLQGISTSPMLGADGSIRNANGYDEATGLWCHDVPIVSVPETPTKEDAQAALLVLRQAFRTFPFADAVLMPEPALGVDVLDLGCLPQLDESTHLTMLMTSVCRPCLTLAPGFLYNASLVSGAGTGKGLAAKAVCVVGSGVPPSAMSAGHDAEELDKRLVAAAIEARPAIFLDNFNEGTLKSDMLASFLTESPARVRVLGQSTTVPLNTRAIVVITGNAVTISEDMARRVLVVGLDAGMENPEQRPFAPGFLQGIVNRRPALLSACLTIWRWGVQQGEALPRGKPIGSYEEWARWCRDPLRALGCRDPVDRLAEIKAADPRRRQLAEVFEKWWEHHTDNPVTAGELHSHVKEAIEPDARHGLDGPVFSRQKVAGYLRKHVNTRAGGFRLQQALPVTTKQKNSVATYQLTAGH